MYLKCRHMLPTGTRCQSPALTNQPYCYFHRRLRLHTDDGTRATKEPLKLPSIEDTRGIQIALAQVLSALGSSRIDPRQAGLYLYGLQIAAKLASAVPHTEPIAVVRDLSCDDQGTELAPQAGNCDPWVDCPNCPSSKTCLDLSRVNMRATARIISRWRDGQDRSDARDAELAQAHPESIAVPSPDPPPQLPIPTRNH